MAKRPRSLSRMRRPTGPELLGGALVGMGVLHSVSPEPFDALVPPWIPGPARAWTYGSGVVEAGVGAAVLAPSTRRLGGLAAAALFVAVFPANLQMAWDWRRKPWPYRAAAFGRLPLQVPMITHALKVAREAG